MISEVDKILDIIGNWLLDYVEDNGGRVTIDTDGFAKISGEFDLSELAEVIVDEAL